MSVSDGSRGIRTIRTPEARQFVRRIVLLLAMLMSGGLMIFPRIPLLAAVFALSFLLISPAEMVRREMSRIWLFLLAVLVIVLIGGEGFHLSATAVRFANFFAVLPLIAIYLLLHRRTLADDLFPLLQLMSIQALITVFLAKFTPGLFQPVQINETTYNTILFLFTFHRSMDLPGLIDRPDGFFFEPGVLQLYLNICLYIALFVKKKPFHVGLALAGVLSTQSTTGAIIAVALLIAAYFRRLRDAALNEKMLILIFAPFLIMPFIWFMIDNIDEKFYGIFRGSRWAREYDLYTGIRVALERPLTGIGFDYQRYFDFAQHFGYLESELDLRTISERPNSNGIATLFYSVGFPLSFVFLWGLFKQRFFADRWLFFMLIVLSMSAEALILTPFPLMLIYSGLLISRRTASVPGQVLHLPLHSHSVRA